jgi:glycosyltransferase involved in cell wall biosynthesis
MRVLLAVHGYPPSHTGGAERAAERIAHWLVKNGHHVEVFTVKKVDSPELKLETSLEDQVVVHRLLFDVRGEGNSFTHTYDNPDIGKVFRRVLKSGSFDIVHLISGYLLGVQIIHAARESGVRTVLTLTEYWFMCVRLNLLYNNETVCAGPESDDKCTRCVLDDKRRYRLLGHYAPSLLNTLWSLAQYSSLGEVKIREITHRQEVLRNTLASVDLVISPSQFLVSKFAEFGYDTQKFNVIRHGVGSPEDHGKNPAKPSAHLRLGFVGQIKYHKGLDLIVQAVVNLLKNKKSVSLDIWGDTDNLGSYITKLLQQTRSFPNIRWKGSFNGSQVLDTLSQIDVLVVPSRWYENSPTVILEAFKAGVPVITTRLGGMAELVKHEKNGLLFDLNNVDELSVNIHRLMDEPQLLAQLRAGIPHIRSADDEVREIFDHYSHLIIPQN